MYSPTPTQKERILKFKLEKSMDPALHLTLPGCGVSDARKCQHLESRAIEFYRRTWVTRFNLLGFCFRPPCPFRSERYLPEIKWLRSLRRSLRHILSRLPGLQTAILLNNVNATGSNRGVTLQVLGDFGQSRVSDCRDSQGVEEGYKYMDRDICNS